MRSVLPVVGIVAGIGGCGRSGFDPLRSDGALTDVAIEDAGTTLDTMLAPDARACFGAGLYTICPQRPIAITTTIGSSMTIDTESSAMCGTYTGIPAALCVVAAKDLTIATGSVLEATGSRPLVLLATQALVIDGTVDVSSRRGGRVGPAANSPACGGGQTPTNKQGGPGGSFGGRGGAGGGGVQSAAVVAAVTELRGGCAGRQGSGGQQGAGGNSGGALYLMAGEALSISGNVNASGAGGNGAVDTAGGGGGGSGGMIVLDAPSISILAGGQVFANGGGGGEGAGNSNSGNPGANPSSALVRAAGGAGGAGAGDGGSGSAGANNSGLAGALGGSSEGGGGGGGAGVIKVYPAQPLTGTISPSPS